MAPGPRRMSRRSQRELCGNCTVVIMRTSTCLGSAFLLIYLSSSILQPTVEPAFRLERDTILLDITESKAQKSNGAEEESLIGDDSEIYGPLVSRVAFGSCTAKRAMEQPIWQDGVIPSNPHAWIWAGDIAYMDWPDVNCKEAPQHHQCSCNRTWLHNSRQTCLSGNVAHAMKKLEVQLQNPDYVKFLQYMCPNAKRTSKSEWGELARCIRPVIGTWDDHDYNWQDGDRRLPTREQQKHLFLDAFGVPFDSPRRANGRGIYWRHTLNDGTNGKEIDVILLDERFHRDSKPCQTRREFCEKACLPDPRKYKHDWCKDFLLGGENGKGSCCRKDEQIWAGWCKIDENLGDPVWEAACNPKSEIYGSSDLAVDNLSGNPVRKSSGHSTSYSDGIVCEVLGQDQRSWLQDELYQSKAPLKLIVSGSPSFNNPRDFICANAIRKRPAVNCTCFDDYDCYRPAQINFLHNLANAPGCAVVLTGDFHFSDIKVLLPGKQTYSEAYESSDLPHPVFQIMASGLTVDTGQRAPCEGYRVDKNRLRPDGECAFVSGPAFGMVEVDWDTPEKTAKLQVRDSHGVVQLESVLRLDTCMPV